MYWEKEMKKQNKNSLAKELLAYSKRGCSELCQGLLKGLTVLLSLTSGLAMLLLPAILTNCTLRRSATVSAPIPKEWKNPEYTPIKRGFYTVDNAMCITVSDAKAVIKNQNKCDTIREDLLDQLTSVNHQNRQLKKNSTPDSKKPK